MAAKEKTQSYVVTRRGLHIGSKSHRREQLIGTVIKLTEKQALSRRGKVELESEHGRVKASDVQMRDAQATIEKLTKDLEAAGLKAEEQSDAIEKLTAALDEATTPPAV